MLGLLDEGILHEGCVRDIVQNVLVVVGVNCCPGATCSTYILPCSRTFQTSIVVGKVVVEVVVVVCLQMLVYGLVRVDLQVWALVLLAPLHQHEFQVGVHVQACLGAMVPWECLAT